MNWRVLFGRPLIFAVIALGAGFNALGRTFFGVHEPDWFRHIAAPIVVLLGCALLEIVSISMLMQGIRDGEFKGTFLNGGGEYQISRAINPTRYWIECALLAAAAVAGLVVAAFSLTLFR